MSMRVQRFGGEHTDEKLKILNLYLDFYTTALKTKPTAEYPFRLIYVDPFCGSGYWAPCGDEHVREGSPLVALSIRDRPFDVLFFNDDDPDNIDALRNVVNRDNPTRQVRYSSEHAESFLLRVCPTLSKTTNPISRGVIFLDPFATQLSWESIESIAATETLDVLLLFPRSALTRSSPNRLRRGCESRFEATYTRVFGDTSWRKLYDQAFVEWFESTHVVAKYQTPRLFDFSELEPNLEFEFRAHASAISYLYREKLKTVFAEVSDTYAVLESNGSPLFEVHFAVSNPDPRARDLAQKGANHILRNFRNVQIKD